MATVCVVKNSRYWQAFWLQDGKQKQKSTKIPVGKTKAEQRKSRELAKITADKMEATAKGQTTLSRACDALRAVAAAYGDEESIPTIRELLNSIPASSKPASELNRQRAHAVFLKWLGEKAELPADRLTADICRDFVRAQLRRVRKGTVVIYRAYIRAAYNIAQNERRIINYNPWATVSVPKELKAMSLPDDTQERQDFSAAEMRRLLTELPREWQDLTATSYYLAGLRLGDCCCLRWEDIDFEHNRIHRTEHKTDNKRSMRLTTPLRARLLARKAAQKPGEQWVYPDFHRRYRDEEASGTLSSEYTTLLKALGIVTEEELARIAAEKERRKREEPNSAKHDLTPKSFHSIRHTVISLMRNNPTLSADAIRATVGHMSEEVERGYFHLAESAEQQVFAALVEAVA